VGAIDGLSAGNLFSIDPLGGDLMKLAPWRVPRPGSATASKERDRFAAEAERQRKTIAAAIATISEGFVLYDSEDASLGGCSTSSSAPFTPASPTSSNKARLSELA